MDRELLAGLRALADGSRIRIVARLAARPAEARELAGELRASVASVSRNLEILLAAGLVERRGPGTFGARLDRVGELGRVLAALQADADGMDAGPGGAWPHEGESLADTLWRLDLPPEEVRVVRSFLRDGRLTTIPAQERKRTPVLRFLRERVFTEDRGYPEKEVNQRLALFHPDVASLRRYLVDGGLVDRRAGIYRRRPEPPTGA